MEQAATDKCVPEGTVGTLTYTRSPMRHWSRIRTNKATERLNREIRMRIRVAGIFSDGRNALILATEHLKHIADSGWGTSRYLDASLLDE